MDSKRKANGTATPDSDDRAAKRRKLAVSTSARATPRQALVAAMRSNSVSIALSPITYAFHRDVFLPTFADSVADLK